MIALLHVRTAHTVDGLAAVWASYIQLRAILFVITMFFLASNEGTVFVQYVVVILPNL